MRIRLAGVRRRRTVNIAVNTARTHAARLIAAVVTQNAVDMIITNYQCHLGAMTNSSGETAGGKP